MSLTWNVELSPRPVEVAQTSDRGMTQSRHTLESPAGSLEQQSGLSLSRHAPCWQQIPLLRVRSCSHRQNPKAGMRRAMRTIIASIRPDPVAFLTTTVVYHGSEAGQHLRTQRDMSPGSRGGASNSGGRANWRLIKVHYLIIL